VPHSPCLASKIIYHHLGICQALENLLSGSAAILASLTAWMATGLGVSYALNPPRLRVVPGGEDTPVPRSAYDTRHIVVIDGGQTLGIPGSLEDAAG